MNKKSEVPKNAAASGKRKNEEIKGRKKSLNISRKEGKWK